MKMPIIDAVPRPTPRETISDGQWWKAKVESNSERMHRFATFVLWSSANPKDAHHAIADHLLDTQHGSNVNSMSTAERYGLEIAGIIEITDLKPLNDKHKILLMESTGNSGTVQLLETLSVNTQAN